MNEQQNQTPWCCNSKGEELLPAPWCSVNDNDKLCPGWWQTCGEAGQVGEKKDVLNRRVQSVAELQGEICTEQGWAWSGGGWTSEQG